MLARGVTKAFPGVIALDDVSLRLEAGRMVALVGENGAGKSTLMSVLSGVIQPDAGVLELDGRAVRFANTRQARDSGVAAIFQELSLAPNLTVAENILLGSEPVTRIGRIDYGRMNEAARVVLERLGLEVSPATRVGSLRVAQQQGVEIARAIREKARVLIMDEPTSALGREETGRLLSLVLDLKRDGVAIVYITHKFEELTGLADEIAVMRDGRLLTQAPYADMTQQEVVRLMVGRAEQAVPLSNGPQATAGGPMAGAALGATPLGATALARTALAGAALGATPLTSTAPPAAALEVRNLSLRPPARLRDFLVRDVSLRVGRGEIVGLFGLIGAGRTELLEAIFGAHGRRTTGEILVHDSPVRVRTPADAVAAGLGLAPEDRKHDGLVLGMSSCENAALARIGLRGGLAFLTRSREADLVSPLLQRLGFKGPPMEEPVRSSSGGNQQKVVLAKWLATDPKVLLLDEPTRGIDVRAKGEFHQCIRELAAQGMGILFASSEIPEVLGLAHRIIVLSQGTVTGEFRAVDTTPDQLLTAALPRGSREALLA
jgi:ribose transport system ATP-binding protein